MVSPFAIRFRNRFAMSISCVGLRHMRVVDLH